MRLLATKAHVIAPDWPGFGDLPRPGVAWTPEALSSFLDHFVRQEVPALRGTIAAGHAATYALYLAAQKPDVLGRLVLVAPTWRGPLPTMAGRDLPLFSAIRRAVSMPVIGPALYRLNVNPFVVRMMVAGHVYGDYQALSITQQKDKHLVIGAPGARFASAAFVTGALDRVRSREAFLDLARRAGRQILVARGAETPLKSLAEMEALGALPMVQASAAPRGKLGVHEEYPADIATVIEEFLSDIRSS
jgi:pimeloyl-ACP methyl ester carboxylesterase